MFLDFKPKIIVVAAVICSLLLFGLYFAYSKLLVDNPLAAKLEVISQVQEIEIDSKDKVVTIMLSDKKNLPDTYRRIEREAASAAYKLELIDNPSETLEEFYNRSQFIVNEGLALGKFTEMLAQLEDLARENEIQGKYYIDDQYIYLDLEQGANSLIAVMPRNLSGDVNKND
ncbi:MAG: hypothetical protein SCK28_14620 [Bacillota bacterium]|nr:hypothetical protein [Bacillota bacterium]